MSNFAAILIIDDEPPVRKSLAALLEDEDFMTVDVDSAEAALEVLTYRHFDVAIVDIRLPGMDGNCFMQEASKKYPALRFIVHTGASSYAIPPALAKRGLSDADVFIKPIFEANLLIQHIRNLLKGGSGQS